MASRVLTTFGILLALVLTAFARREVPVALDSSTKATLVVSSPFETLPPTGYAPLEVKIHNQTGRRATWKAATANNNYSRLGTWQSDYSFTVEHGAERTFRVSVPLNWGNAGGGFSLLLSGPGIDTRAYATIPQHGSSNAVPFVGLSESLVQFAPIFLKEKTDASWTTLRMNEMPEDWRTLAGFDTVWLAPNDLRALSASQKSTLQEWLARGGFLRVFGTGSTSPEWAETGFGKLEWMDDGPPDAVKISQYLKNTPARQGWFQDSFTDWPLASEVSEIQLNVGFLSLVLVVLALVLGPINLFVFAGRLRRSRLLWTTPLIALVASALLTVFIFLQDGVGGSGARLALIHLLPGQSKAAVLQEQVSRHGVLLATSFTLEQPSLLAPIVESERQYGTRRRYSVQGEEYGGSWFESKTRQGQWIETIIPSRAEVRVVARGANGAPTVVSSIDAPLENLYLRMPDRTLWKAETLQPGEKRELIPAPGKLPPFFAAGTTITRSYGSNLSERPGYFYAQTTAARSLQPTLRSIRWDKQQALYTGAVTGLTP